MKQSILLFISIFFLSINLNAQKKESMGTNMTSSNFTIAPEKGKTRQKSLGEKSSVWDQSYSVGKGEWITPVYHPKEYMTKGVTYEVKVSTTSGDADLQISADNGGSKRVIRESQESDLTPDESFYSLDDLQGSENSIHIGIKGYKESTFRLQILEVQTSAPVDPCTIIDVTFNVEINGGKVNLTINTSLPQEITFVEFKANGESLGGDDEAPFSYEYQPTNFGNQDFEAIINYAQIDETCTLRESVYVEKPSDPCENITSEFILASKMGAFGAMVELSISTNFPQEITKVEYFANGNSIGWSDRSPFTYNHQTNNGSDNNYEAKISYAQSSETCTLTGKVAESTTTSDPCDGIEFLADKSGLSGGTQFISLEVRNTSNKSISRVEFYDLTDTDNNRLIIGKNSGQAFSHSFSLSAGDNGDHEYGARIFFDNNNEVCQSDVITIYGSGGDVVKNGDDCNFIDEFKATSNSSGGVDLTISSQLLEEITRVDYFKNGQQIGSIFQSPFSFNDINGSASSDRYTATFSYAQTNETCTLDATISSDNTSQNDPCELINNFDAGELSNGDIALTISSDFLQEVSKVDYFKNGQQIGSIFQSPFTYYDRNVSSGNHRYKAVISFAQQSADCEREKSISIGSSSSDNACQGTTDPSRNCPNNYNPVCGCNDVTYSNSCLAQAAGVKTWTSGECGNTQNCSYWEYTNRDDWWEKSFKHNEKVYFRPSDNSTIETVEFYDENSRIGSVNKRNDGRYWFTVRTHWPEGIYNCKVRIKRRNCSDWHEQSFRIRVVRNHTCKWTWKNKNELCEKHFNHGSHWKWRMEPEHRDDIEWVEWYKGSVSNSNRMRRESSYPYEWNSQSSGDSKMRNWGSGRHKVIIWVKKKCRTEPFKQECWIHFDGNGNDCKGVPVNKYCPQNYAPVCGCDDVTYNNECHAEAAGVKTWRSGACSGGGNNNCRSGAWFKVPRNNRTFSVDDHIYVRVDAERHLDIEYMELFINNRFVRRENNAPYEWNRPDSNNSDDIRMLRGLKAGTYNLKCRYKTKCGKYYEKSTKFFVSSN